MLTMVAEPQVQTMRSEDTAVEHRHRSADRRGQGSYHLLQLPLFSRKLRVVTDWTTSLFFRRDIAELGQLGHPEKLG